MTENFYSAMGEIQESLQQDLPFGLRGVEAACHLEEQHNAYHVRF